MENGDEEEDKMDWRECEQTEKKGNSSIGQGRENKGECSRYSWRGCK